LNFLLHRHLCAADLASDEAAAGAMLPDLVRMAGARPRPDALADLATPLGQGVAHHLELDRWFHLDGAFHDAERRAARALAAALPGVRKLAPFGHPLWEMCLDGALVLDAGFAPTMEELVRALAHVRAWAGSARGEALGAVALTRLRSICDALEAGWWVLAYTQGPGLAFCVDGMRRRLGLSELGPEALGQLEAPCSALLDEARAALPALLARAPRPSRPAPGFEGGIESATP
jgi:acyl carrier protein phosphodiesterase